MKVTTVDLGINYPRVNDSTARVAAFSGSAPPAPIAATAAPDTQPTLKKPQTALPVPNARAANLGVLIDQTAVSFTSFAASILVGRSCGSEELGAFSLAVSIFWLVAGIPNALVWTPYLTRFTHLPAARRRLFLGSVTNHLFGLSLGLAAVLLVSIWIPWPGLTDQPWFTPLCLALVPYTVLMLVREHLRRIHLAHLDPARLLWLDVPVCTLQFACMATLAWLGKLSAPTALLCMAAGCLPAVASLIASRTQFPIWNRRIWHHLGHNFKFGRWLLVMSITWLLGDAALRWFVGAFHGRAELGRFAAAFTPVLFINPLVLTIQNLARSYAARVVASDGRHKLLSWTWRQSVLLAIGAAVLLSSIALFGSQLVDLMYGSEFAGLGGVVGWLCLGVFLQVLTVPPEAALSALQDGRAILKASSVRLSLILLAGIPLIWSYLSLGVGITLAISSLAAALVQWHYLRGRCLDA